MLGMEISYTDNVSSLLGQLCWALVACLPRLFARGGESGRVAARDDLAWVGGWPHVTTTTRPQLTSLLVC